MLEAALIEIHSRILGCRNEKPGGEGPGQLNSNASHFYVYVVGVPCKDVILHARASSSTDVNVKRLGEVPLTHSESGVHKVLEASGCSLEVPLSYVDIPTQKKMPYITMTSWVQFLSKSDRLHYLTGVADGMERRKLCREFWTRVQQIRPGHPVFADASAGTIRLEDTVPLLHHGDEGRSYRKTPIMILSTHGLLGSGSHKTERPKGKTSLEHDGMDLNFIGATMTTHYIFTAMPHALYKKEPAALDVMLSLYAQDLRRLAGDGITLIENGVPRKLWFVCFGAKGDLPYLGKAGGFTRTFSMCAKKSSSKGLCKGICFMCDAGREGLPSGPCPWEDFNTNATWTRTMGLQPGFNTEGPLLQIPHDHSVLFYRLDIWHCWHLGIGKTFIASVLVELLDALADEGSLETRLDAMFANYAAHCKKKKVYGYLTSFTRDFLGFDKASSMPVGHWSKGHVTTRLFVWLEEYLDTSFKDARDPMIQVRATKLGNMCIRGLYRCGVWMPAAQGKKVATWGLQFLQAYGQLATLAFRRGQRRFCLIPKLHFVHHIMQELLCQSASSSWALNPLTFSVQMQEDFIGRPSRISRRVSPKAQALRTQQRVLLCMFGEFMRVEGGKKDDTHNRCDFTGPFRMFIQLRQLCDFTGPFRLVIK
ncbi:unnamed protein product, partial [Symbiodinium sp. CCMP2456]